MIEEVTNKKLGFSEGNKLREETQQEIAYDKGPEKRIVFYEYSLSESNIVAGNQRIIDL